MKGDLHQITLLFEKRDREGLTPEEEKILRAWVDAAPEERSRDLEKSQDPLDWLPEIKDAIKVMDEGEQSEAVGRKKVLQLIRDNRAAEKVVVPMSKSRYWLWAAASLAAVLVTSILFLYRTQKPGIPNPVSSIDSTDINLQQRAILSLVGGKTILLKADEDRVLPNQAGTKLVQKGGQLYYQPDSSAAVAYSNHLTTPKGCQYVITLPDQTTVWLNAGSILDFPSAFPGDKREVTLYGEAYFEVAHNSKKTFIVNYGDMMVEVKGTKFNINGYQPHRIITTLAEGSVKVRQGKSGRMLIPGQQSIATDKDPILVQTADLDKVLAWKQGRFYFEDEDLESIMETLSRWYDIKVIFEQPVTEKYSGSFKRSMPIEKVLSSIQAYGGVRFQIVEGKVIRVTRH